MGVTTTEFECFEQQFLELLGEFQTVSNSESRLRDSVRVESTRAEAAEAARDVADRAAAEARCNAAAAAASTTQASVTLTKVQDELAATKMQFELAERHRVVLEEKCSELSAQVESLKRELKKLRPLQTMQSNLQRQYAELQERIHNTTLETRREASRLETELRRVEKSVSGGAEIRDRARLAAAAHVRERRLAAAELQHTNSEMQRAKAEITRLGAVVAELQCRLSEHSKQNVSAESRNVMDLTLDALAEARAELEAERSGTDRLERALAAALADNAALATQLHSSDNATAPMPASLPRQASSLSAICQIDSFLAD